MQRFISGFNTDQGFDDFLKRIPDVRTLKLRLRQLLHLTECYLFPEQVEKLYFENAFLVPQAIRQNEKSLFKNFTIFRVRDHLEDDPKKVNNPLQYSYPPSGCCNENGRANIIGHPVFYGSESVSVCIFESKLKSGDIVYLGQWKVKCSKPTISTQFFGPNMNGKSAFIDIAIDDMADAVRDFRKYSEPELLLELFRFSANVFLDEKMPYSLSSWLAYRQIYENGCDFIAYPSYETKNNGINMAFNPNFVKKHFTLERVFKIRSHGYTSDGAIKIDGISIGLNHGSLIKWRPFKKRDEDELKHLIYH